MRRHTISSHKIILTIALLLFSVFNVFIFINNVSAASWPTDNYGYFYGKLIQTSNGLGNDVIMGGIPDWVQSKSDFIAFISNLYNNPANTYNGKNNRVGAAYIIQTMRGLTGSGTHSMPSSSDISDWKARINDLNIKMGVDEPYTYTVNTRSDVSSFDVSRFSSSDTKNSIVFYAGTKQVYVVKISCGNPLGELPGVPKLKVWTIAPIATVISITDASGHNTGSLTTAKPGDIITWRHVIKNTGPDATDREVIYDSLNSQYLGTGNGPNKTQQSGLPKDRTSPKDDYLTYYTVPAGVQNVEVCRATRVWPYAWNVKSTTDYSSSVGKTSSAACVTIGTPIHNPPPQSSICRPIVVVVKPVTYPAVSHTAPNGAAYYYPSTTIPVDVYINGVFYGQYTTVTSIDLTSRYTTGDQYTVTMREDQGHISSYTDNYTIDYNSPIYASDGKTVVGYNSKYTSTSTNTTSAAILSTSTIGPCYDYTLTANTNPLSAYAVEVGASINVRPYVTSDPWTETGYQSFYQTYGTHTKSKPSKWQITKMIVPPDTPPPSYESGGISSVDPCSYFDPGNVSTCSSQLDNNSTVFGISGNPSTNLNSTYTVPDDPAGTKICFAFSVFPNQSDPLNTSSSWGADDQWYHSTFDPKINCVIIAKHPKAQIWGGDLWTRGSVYTSTTIKSSSAFGSWSEYGIIAAGGITGAASGAAYAGPSGLVNATTCKASQLSFTNNIPLGSSNCNNNNSIGYYSNAPALPDVAAGFPISSSTPSVPSNLTGLISGTYTASGDITIAGGNIGKGESIVINAPNSNVTIADNINYAAGSLATINDIPQVVIIANSITINSNVTEVDAWLVATKNNNSSIKTCDQEGTTVDQCSQPLIVNGPVITNHLYLYRTAGSGTGTNSGDPAEIFNLRPDAYLWAYNKASNSGRIQTTYITELPPRF